MANVQGPEVTTPYYASMWIVTTVRYWWKEQTQKQKKRNTQLQLQQQEYLTTDRQTRSKEHLKHNEPKQCRIEDVLYFFWKLKGLGKNQKQLQNLNDLKCTECPDFFPVILLSLYSSSFSYGIPRRISFVIVFCQPMAIRIPCPRRRRGSRPSSVFGRRRDEKVRAKMGRGGGWWISWKVTL